MTIGDYTLTMTCFCGSLIFAACERTGVAPVVHPIPLPVEEKIVKPVAHNITARRTSTSLRLARPDTLPLLKVDFDLTNALLFQENYLRKKSTPEPPAPGFNKKEMLRTVQTLRELPFVDLAALAENFDFYQLNTDLKSDRVRVTGYYTPALDARKQRTRPYVYPLLRRAGSGMDSTQTADSLKVSRGAGIVGEPLAWVKTKRELANAQLQGSCLVEFPGGKRQFLGFGGSVPHAGSKYVFFTKMNDQVIGAGNFPMTPDYSIAIDPKVAPLGSVIFAELPQLDAAGKLKGYTYRIVLAQDRGGAIKTSKRVDLYCGIGKEGLAAARKINQYGRFWVLLPKKFQSNKN